jgi:hypothetical protein
MMDRTATEETTSSIMPPQRGHPLPRRNSENRAGEEEEKIKGLK